MPSRVRAFCALGVGDELFVDGIGDASLETTDGLLWLLPRSSLPAVVGAALAVQAQLGDRGDVDHVVDPAVPGPRKPVAVLLTGGSVEWCGAGPGREPVAVGEPSDVTDVGHLPSALRAALDHDGPSVVSVECSADEMPPFAPFLDAAQQCSFEKEMMPDVAARA